MFKPKKWMIEVVADWNDIQMCEVDLSSPEAFYSVYVDAVDISQFTDVNHTEYVDFVHRFSTWIADPFAQDAISFAKFLFEHGQY